MDIQKILEKVDKILKPQPILKFEVVKQNAGLFDNKIGGTPYFPKNMEYPTGKNGEFKGKPLKLLAQLNFEQLPHIPDFPQKGILQFFIAPDDLYGMSLTGDGGLTAQDNFRIVYHKDIITDESELMTDSDMPNYSGSDFYMPFKEAYKLIPSPVDEMKVSPDDFRFIETFMTAYKELYNEDIDDFWDIIDDEEYDDLYERNDEADAFIGGYPVFTQEDPRYDEALADCDTLLFELNSVYNDDVDIMWGDSGTGSFFIPREALKRLDFSKVIYNYDCC